MKVAKYKIDIVGVKKNLKLSHKTVMCVTWRPSFPSNIKLVASTSTFLQIYHLIIFAKMSNLAILNMQ